MDDESAEIELLEQNLNKTRQISQRMTSILSSFDTRLVKLEKSILPLYSSTQVLTKRANNIESVLLKIDEVTSIQEGVAAEESLILRGPQPGQLNAYTEVLERLNASIAFNSRDSSSSDTARLVETGAKKLIQLYTKLVAEGSSGTPPNASAEYVIMSFPNSLLGTLRSLVAFLRTLPLPPTHPSHPAAPAIQAALKDAQKGYGDMRGSWIKKCLEPFGRRILERAEARDGVAVGNEFGQWVDHILNTVEEEYALLAELAPLPSPAMISATYTTLITPVASLFSSTLSSLTALIKRSLLKHSFLALITYSSLTASQPRWEDAICRRAGRKENEVKDGLVPLRATCLRSFPEFLADLRLAALGKNGDISTGVVDFAVSAVKYIQRIPEVRDAAGAALLALGDGNWKMGEGTQVGKDKKTIEIDEQTILEHYIFDIVNAVVNSLQTVSRMNKRPAFGSIFLLNNISYLRTELLSPRSPALSLLSKPTQEVLQSNFRTAKAGYFDSNFSPLIQTLVEEKEKSKSATKEKFTRFFDLLDEVAERHKMASVLQDDKEGRETVADEAVKLVVPSLQRFIQRNLGKEFSKNPQKYIKMSANEVETLIQSFYG